jgi:hypothetical protein
MFGANTENISGYAEIVPHFINVYFSHTMVNVSTDVQIQDAV